MNERLKDRMNNFYHICHLHFSWHWLTMIGHTIEREITINIKWTTTDIWLSIGEQILTYTYSIVWIAMHWTDNVWSRVAGVPDADSYHWWWWMWTKNAITLQWMLHSVHLLRHHISNRLQVDTQFVPQVRLSFWPRMACTSIGFINIAWTNPSATNLT